jgi:hypothetical protein
MFSSNRFDKLGIIENTTANVENQIIYTGDSK